MGEGGEIEEPVDEGPAAPSVLDQEPGQDLSGGRLDVVSRPNEWDLGGSQEEPPSYSGDETADAESEPVSSAIPDPDSDGLTVVSLPSSPVAPKQVEGASQEDRALLDRTQKWLQQAIGLLAREGRHKVADDLRSQLNRQPKERPTVIVAGEDKRGKISLVNALM
jgi:hypothetical protein